MVEGPILDMTGKAMTLVLLLSLPTVAVAALVGISVGLLQALTQVQEQALAFVLKLVAVFATLFLTVRWAGNGLYQFSVQLFDAIPMLVR